MWLFRNSTVLGSFSRCPCKVRTASKFRVNLHSSPFFTEMISCPYQAHTPPPDILVPPRQLNLFQPLLVATPQPGPNSLLIWNKWSPNILMFVSKEIVNGLLRWVIIPWFLKLLYSAFCHQVPLPRMPLTTHIWTPASLMARPIHDLPSWSFNHRINATDPFVTLSLWTAESRVRDAESLDNPVTFKTSLRLSLTLESWLKA